MKRSTIFSAICALALGLALATGARAQEGGEPIKLKPDELKAHDDVKNAPTVEQAIAAAKVFMQKFPQSAALDNVEIEVYNKIIESPLDASRLPHIEAFKQTFPASKRTPALELTVIQPMIDAGKFAEVKRIGEAYLAQNPDHLRTHYLLMRIAVDAVKAKDGSLLPSGKTHGERAIAIFEAPGVPSGFANEAEWAEYKKTNLPLAYQSMGVIGLATGDAKMAASYFEKAIGVDANEPLNFFFLASLREQEYTDLATRYKTLAESKSPEADAALKAATAKMDEVVELLIKTVARAEGRPEILGQARPTLEGFWKYRHDGKLDGLEEAIRAAKGGGK